MSISSSSMTSGPVYPRLSTAAILVCLALISTTTGQGTPPQITMAPRDHTVVDGNVVTFFCKASGNPAPSFRWYKVVNGTGRLIDGSRRYMTRDMPNGSVLRIEPVRSGKDDKEFYCLADNGNGEPAIGRAQLTVYKKGQVPNGYPRVVESPTLKAVEVGRPSLQICVTEGDPQPTVTWLKYYIPVDLSDDRLQVLPSGSLVINSTKVSDEGKYECVAENPVGLTYSYGANLYVRVRRVPPYFTDLPNGSIEIIAGDSFNLTCVAVGSPMPFVKWKQGDVQLTPYDTIPIGKNVLMITESRQSANYTCLASSDLGNIEHTTSIIVKDSIIITATLTTTTHRPLSSDTAPGSPPVDVQARAISSRTVVVQWNEPEIPNGIIRGYHVLYTLTPDLPLNLWTLHPVLDVHVSNLKNLQSNCTYTIIVQAYNRVGVGPLSDPIQVNTNVQELDEPIYAGTVVPGPPKNLQGEVVSANAIQLSWDSPENSVDSIQSYLVYYNDSHFHQNVRITISPPVTRYLIEDLTPDTLYHFMVTARSTWGESAPTQIIIVHTLLYIPGSPGRVQVQAIDSTAIRVEWQAPQGEKTTGIIRGYLVHYTEVTVEDDPIGQPAVYDTHGDDIQSVIIPDLQPDTWYQVQVSAYTRKGDGDRSPPKKVKTTQPVPPAPTNLRTKLISQSAVEVSWDSPDFQPITGYRIYYNMFAVPDMDLWLRMEVGPYTVAVIPGLERFFLYAVRVRAKTTDGLYGDFSEIVVAGLTDQSPPPFKAPTFVRSVSDSMLIVNLFRATGRNGPITSYDIMVRSEGPELTQEAIDTYNTSQYTAAVFLEGLPQTFRLGDGTRPGTGEYINKPLNPGHRYWVFVRAHTSNIHQYTDSPFSDIMTTNTTTLIATHSRRQKRSVPQGAPKRFTINGVSSTIVKLTWDDPAPDLQNGDIILYEVVYYKRFFDFDTYVVNTTEKMMVIEGLEGNTDYLYLIRAYTSEGTGPWSNKMVYRTFSPLSPSPTNVRVRLVTPTSIEVRWDPPDSQHIAGYRIYYNKFAVPDMDLWPSIEIGPYLVATIDGLEHFVSYSVRVRAKHVDGRYGDFSETVTTLAPSGEDVVQRFHSRTHNPRSVMLAWSPPRTDLVTKYKIVFKGQKTYLDEYGVEQLLTDEWRTKVISPQGRTAYIDGLIPMTTYNFNISANFMDGRWGEPSELHVETNSAAPPPFKAPTFVRSVSDSMLIVNLFGASGRNGPITAYDVMVRSEGPELIQSTMTSGDSDISQYTAGIFLKTLPQTFQLGDGTRPGTGEYINKPLNPGHRYQVFVRAHTAFFKYADSPFSDIMATELNTTDIFTTESMRHK